MSPIHFLPLLPAVLDLVRPAPRPPANAAFEAWMNTSGNADTPFALLPAEARAQAAAGHLGEEVSLRLSDGTRLEGRLDAVRGVAGDLRLELGGRTVPLTQVLDLQPLAAA